MFVGQSLLNGQYQAARRSDIFCSSEEFLAVNRNALVLGFGQENRRRQISKP
jgi:hypothetical protein